MGGWGDIRLRKQGQRPCLTVFFPGDTGCFPAPFQPCIPAQIPFLCLFGFGATILGKALLTDQTEPNQQEKLFSKAEAHTDPRVPSGGAPLYLAGLLSTGGPRC